MSKESAVGIAVCMFQVSTTVPTEIQLTPAGLFRARDGRPDGLPGWVINKEIAANVIARAHANVNKTVIDYDHQTLYAEENGKPAPAAGWYTRLEWREGLGLFATDVQWTPAAQATIDNGEYLYISPVIAYDRQTGEVTGILMAALTNYAAIDGMQSLEQRAAAHFSINKPTETDAMNEALLALLGLEEGASEEDVNKAVAALTAKLENAEKSSETIEGLKAKVDEQATALKAKADDNPDPAKYVPIEAMNELREEFEQLSGRINGKEIDDLVEVALSEGKLLAAQEDWARKYGEQDIAGLRAYLDKAQPIAALKGSQTNGKQPGGQGGDGELTDDELAVCKATGIDPEDYKKTKAAEAAA